jgi:hypothetical protein
MSFNTNQDTEKAESADPQQELSESLDQGETTFVTSEPKKQISGSTLGVFGVLALCAAGTFFMYVRGGPAAANAEDETTAANITTFLDEGKQHVTLMKQMLQNTEKVVQQFRKSSIRMQIPVGNLHTNPFRMEAPAKAGPVNESEIAARRRHDEERAAVVEAAKALRLQLILYGESNRSVLVNDKVVAEGQAIDSLTIEKIYPDKIIIRSGIYRVEKVFQNSPDGRQR